VIGGGLWIRASRRRPAPIEALLPDAYSLAVRVSGFERGFLRHWALRGRDQTTEAVIEVLRSLELWPQWELKYGPDGARTRIEAYRRALFELAGEETWLVFGAWPGPEGSEEPALMLYSREDSFLKARLGPLAELWFPGHKVRSSTYRGRRVYEYLDERDSRAITAASVDGWICASLRNPRTTAVWQVIDQVEAAGASEPTRAVPADWETGSSVITGVFHPARFWEDLERFDAARGKSPSEDRERRLAKWSERLGGIESVHLRQTGGSLLNFDLTLRGDRVAELTEAFQVAFRDEPAQGFGDTPAGLPAPLVQFDFYHPFAIDGMPVLGLRWEGLLADLDKARWFNAPLVNDLERMFLAKAASEPSRVGVALFREARLPIPAAATWQDRAEPFRTNLAPADAWRLATPASVEAMGDTFRLYGIPRDTQPTTDTLAAAKRQLGDGLWSARETPPLGFVVAHFDELAGWMRSMPLIFLSSKSRDRWVRYRSLMEGLNLALGSVAARLDRRDRELTLSIRTLELSS